ncbi:MAG: hypothetical protein IKF35_02405, partial [Solobacterium sp.]|nr:hypothetical protein [Solobacterium sp.]
SFPYRSKAGRSYGFVSKNAILIYILLFLYAGMSLSDLASFWHMYPVLSTKLPRRKDHVLA